MNCVKLKYSLNQLDSPDRGSEGGNLNQGWVAFGKCPAAKGEVASKTEDGDEA